MTLLPYILCALSVATPWWDDFPRIVETPQLDQAQAHHANIGMCAAHTDPGWGLYGQVLTRHEERGRAFQEAGLKSISYAETFGQSYCFIAELAAGGPWPDHRPTLRSHWNWRAYGGGEIAWVGMHDWFDDEAFARPYTRTHPRYGGPAMTYPDGTPATGYLGPENDPRNSRVYDASMAKDILGRLALDYHFIDTSSSPQLDNAAFPEQARDALLPVGDRYSGLVLFAKDSACPLFIDYTRASIRMAADHGSDGIWSDNFSAWDSFGMRPVQNAFGAWSVARFRGYLKEHFSADALAAMGVADPDTFDVRAALRAFMRSLGGNDEDLQDPLWHDPRWLDLPLWRAYIIFKRQTGTEALSAYYRAVKEAAAESGRPDFFLAGNDVEFMLGWPRGDLDMVSSELSPHWGLMTGPQGIPLFPAGRFAPLYKLGREHARSRFVNIWLYLENQYAPYRLNPGLVNTFYYEMLANHALPMFHPSNPRVAGTEADNAAFFAFVERVAPEYGGRTPVEDIGIYYSSSSALRDMTPGGIRNHADQPHHFGLLGWATALGELHYPYRVIAEWRCTAQTLDALRLMVIPEAEVLDPAWVESTLKPWLDRGGRLVFTGPSGCYRGEDENFDRYANGSCLDSFKGMPTVFYLPENLGGKHYALRTLPERDTLRPAFAKALTDALGDVPERIQAPGVPPTVGITLYEDIARSRFFIDLNNMDLNVEADTVRPTGELSFALRLPDWMVGRDVSGQVLTPDMTPDLTLEKTSASALALRLSSVNYYAGIILTAL